MVWPFSGARRPSFRLLRSLAHSLEGIHNELKALRGLLETGASGGGSTEQAARAFRTSHPQPDAPPLHVLRPADLDGSLIEYQEAHERITEALGREPDDEEVIREVERNQRSA